VKSNKDEVKRICSLKVALPKSREEMAHALAFDSPPRNSLSTNLVRNVGHSFSFQLFLICNERASSQMNCRG